LPWAFPCLAVEVGLVGSQSFKRWMNVTLGRRMRKTRRAVEKQLMQQDMSKQDAQQLSLCYEDLKNNITGMLKEGITNCVSRQNEERCEAKNSGFSAVLGGFHRRR